MTIERIWAMPNKRTFSIAPIKQLLSEEVVGGMWVDPFAGMNSPAQVTNDLNPESNAVYHMDALDFLKTLDSGAYDGVLYDPPYSQRQVAECYKGVGKTGWDGRSTFWSDTKNECARILKPEGKAICFGWNSMGLGLNRGFQITRILMVPHGGFHNDTLVTVEIKHEAVNA